MLIRWAEIYANTDVLSPIDRETWRVIGETSRLDSSSRVIELASGKGVFANYLAKNFGCRVDGFDINPEFVDYSNNRTKELALQSRVKFAHTDTKQLQVPSNSYDLGVCLGALYIFRERGWNILTRSVNSQGYLAISDLVCKKVPPPKEVKDVFFEEPGEPLTIDAAREWYYSRGARIIQEIECSQKAWLDVSQGMDSYLQTMEDLSLTVGKMSRQFQHAEGWRRHLHLGFSQTESDPLRDSLGKDFLLNPDYQRRLERGP